MKYFWLAMILLVAQWSCAEEKHFLWSAKDKDSEIWLIGSIHMAPKGLYPLPKVMEDAFSNSKELAVELDISSDTTVMQVAQSMLTGGMYPKGDGLDKHISAKTLARLDSFFNANKVPAQSMHSLKPWLLAIRMGTMVISNAGAESEQGIDIHFIEQANVVKKPVIALETAGQQMALFQSLPDSLQEVMLEWTMDESINMTTLLDSLFLIWKSGDAAAMEKFVMQDVEKDPRFLPFFQKLYTDRNVNMAAKAEDFLKKNSKVLIVVGSAHLVGAQGVPSLLQKKGYTVQQW